MTTKRESCFAAAVRFASAPESSADVERYAYDAAGRLVREGGRTYRYGYLDKVLAVTEGKTTYKYDYHVDGQLARADYGDGNSETFAWDGLALIRRGDERFVNEPHVGNAPKKLRFGGKPRAKRSARRARKGPRGNPVVSSKGATYFNDVLGTTVGVREGRGAARKGAKRRYTAAALTAFGEPVPVAATSHNSNIRQFDHSIISSPFFTGKPEVEGLGRVFLYRNYRADLAKWQTADPLGYPDGWNQLAYCNNWVMGAVDLLGACTVDILGISWDLCHIMDVWAECNHSFQNPVFNIVMGKKDGHVYANRLVLSGHTYTFKPRLAKAESSVRVVDPWNKEIVYDVLVVLEITDTWTEDVVDDQGQVIGSITVRQASLAELVE